MRTIFDLISTNTGTDESWELIKELLSSTDFDSRLGKKIYLNWLDSLTKSQGLNKHNRADLVNLASNMRDALFRKRLLYLAIDFAKRNSNLVFVETIAFVNLRDFTSLSIRGPSESDYTTMKALVDLMSFWVAHVKTRQKLEIDAHRDFIIFSLIKLAFCFHYYPDNQIQSLLVDLLYITGRPSEIQAMFKVAGAVDMWVLFRSLTLKHITLPVDSNEDIEPPSTRVLYDFVPSQALSLVPSSVARLFGGRPRSGADPSFFDLCMLFRAITHIEPSCDLSAVVKEIEKSTLTSFESMVIHYGIVGRLIVGIEDEGAVHVMVNGIRNPDAQLFMCKVLEYLCVQLMSYPKWATVRRGMIQSLFIRRLNATPNKEFVKQLILDNCPGAVKAFLGESIAKQASIATTHVTVNQTTKPPSSVPTDELTQLLESLKRRRTE